MIQQLIYRGTAEGYRVVAISGGLAGKGLARMLQGLSRMPANWMGAAPIFSRTVVEGGMVVMRTAVDPNGTRNHHISHIYYVPGKDVPAFSKAVIPVDAFEITYRDTHAVDTLAEIEPDRWTDDAIPSLATEAMNRLFGGNAELLARFLWGVTHCAAPVQSRQIKGVCVVGAGDAAAMSADAYAAMEALLRLYPELWASGIGYRTLWTVPENNVQYPVYFVNRQCAARPDQAEGAGYLVIDVQAGKWTYAKGELPTPEAELTQLAQALAQGEPQGVAEAMTAMREARERARLEAQRRAEEEAARQRLEQQRRAEEAARQRLEQQRRAEEAARQRLEQQRRAEEAARQRLEEKRRAEEEARRQAEAQRRAEEEARRQAEAQRGAEEEARRQAEAQRRVEEEARRQAEEQRRAEEDRQRQENQRVIQEALRRERARKAEPAVEAEHPVAPETSAGGKPSAATPRKQPSPSPAQPREAVVSGREDPYEYGQRLTQSLLELVLREDWRKVILARMQKVDDAPELRDLDFRLTFLDAFLTDVAEDVLPMHRQPGMTSQAEALMYSATWLALHSRQALFHRTTLGGVPRSRYSSARNCFASLRRIAEETALMRGLRRNQLECQIWCSVFNFEPWNQRMLAERLQCLETIDPDRRKDLRRDLGALAADSARLVGAFDDRFAKCTLSALFFEDLYFREESLAFDKKSAVAVLGLVQSRPLARQLLTRLEETAQAAATARKRR